MKIGILSDTHGNLHAARNAASLLLQSGVGAVFHCGDIGGMDVLVELAAIFQPLAVPVHVVFGNTDIYCDDWKFFPTNIGVFMYGRFGDIEYEGRRIALLHSDDRRRYHQAVSCGDYDLVLSGHSHSVHDYREGRTRCINPGTAGRGSPNTFAVLDMDDGKLTIFNC